MDDSAALADDLGGRGTEGRVQDFDLGVRAASVLVSGYGCDLHGWAIAESTGAAVAKVRIRDGRDVGGAVVAPITLVASGSSAVWFGENGVACESGVFLEVVAGSVEAVLYLVAPTIRARR